MKNLKMMNEGFKLGKNKVKRPLNTNIFQQNVKN